MSLRWKREFRIKKSKDFRFVQQNGRKWRSKDFLILYIPTSNRVSRVGLVVSKKVGNSVVRNQVKRWLREASRHHYSELPSGLEVVIIAYSSAFQVQYHSLFSQIYSAFKGVSRKLR